MSILILGQNLANFFFMCQKRSHNFRIKVCPAGFLQNPERLFHRKRFLINTLAGQGIKHINHRHDSGTERDLLAGKMITRTCLLLAWELLRGGTPIASGHAANDVVVGRGAIARVLPVHVSVDGEDMGVVRSDGVIVSTPLGSSAYALSAHGPLVHPKVQALTLTPISPFFKSFPPIVLPADSRIRLETDDAAPDAFLTVDGQEGIPLCGGDVIRVQSLDAGLRVLSCSSGTYFQRLRERGFIQTGGTSAPEQA